MAVREQHCVDPTCRRRCGKRSWIDEHAGAIDLDQDAGMAEMGEMHLFRFRVAPGNNWIILLIYRVVVLFVRTFYLEGTGRCDAQEVIARPGADVLYNRMIFLTYRSGLF